MMFTRSSSTYHGETAFTRYKYFRLELDLLAAWVESENFEDGKSYEYKSILGALYLMQMTARQPLHRLKEHKLVAYRQMERQPNKYHQINPRVSRTGGNHLLMNKTHVNPSLLDMREVAYKTPDRLDSFGFFFLVVICQITHYSIIARFPIFLSR